MNPYVLLQNALRIVLYVLICVNKIDIGFKYISKYGDKRITLAWDLDSVSGNLACSVLHTYYE